MMLLVVPAVIWPTVTTAGSKMSTRRVTINCSACTISQAIGIGSIVRNGSLACPPAPLTTISNVSAGAIAGPPLVGDHPDGQRRGDVERERTGDR